MRRRHPMIPGIWLMTDERMGDGLWAALERLPRGAGVVFRHYRLAEAARNALLDTVKKVAARRALVLVVAGKTHNGRRGRQPGLRTASAHNRREAIAAIRTGADAIFVSPVFATRSHPGAKALGRVRFGLMVRGLPVPVIALGGMDAKRARSLRTLGSGGWAAIDAWMR